MILIRETETLSWDELEAKDPGVYRSMQRVDHEEDRYVVERPGNGAKMTLSRAHEKGLLPTW